VTRRVALRDQEAERLTNDYVAKHGYPDGKWRQLMADYFKGDEQLFSHKELEQWDQFMKTDPRFNDTRVKAGKSGPAPPAG
jgi:hypothetical protein